MRIRTYETFTAALEIANNDLYRVMYRPAYEDAIKRLHMLEAFEPRTYKTWLDRWKKERKAYV